VGHSTKLDRFVTCVAFWVNDMFCRDELKPEPKLVESAMSTEITLSTESAALVESTTGVFSV
jgi:hypothetical protein